MNENEIEELLRKAPKVAPPADLKMKLQRAVRVAPPAEDFESPSLLRRWIPALSFAVLLFASTVAIGVQTSTIGQLKRQNEQLRATAQTAEPSNSTASELKRLQAAAQELERLRKDRADLDVLRKEVAELRAKVAAIEPLRAENQRLRNEITTRRVALETGVEMTPEQLEQEKAKAERARCINNLKQIGLAARTWSTDNNDVLPSDFLSMTNELNTWKILQCSSDRAHVVNGWADVAAGNVSYQIISPGIPETFPGVVYVVCPTHGVLLADGSVQAIGSNWQQQVKMVDGKMYYEPRTRN